MSDALLYIGGALVLAWGIAHLMPTRNVVADFGDISDDNRNIITMEWIVEGVALIFCGILVMVITSMDSSTDESKAVFLISAIQLYVLALVSFFTGFRVKFPPFRMCPFMLGTSATLILIGAYV